MLCVEQSRGAVCKFFSALASLKAQSRNQRTLLLGASSHLLELTSCLNSRFEEARLLSEDDMDDDAGVQPHIEALQEQAFYGLLTYIKQLHEVKPYLDQAAQVVITGDEMSSVEDLQDRLREAFELPLLTGGAAQRLGDRTRRTSPTTGGRHAEGVGGRARWGRGRGRRGENGTRRRRWTGVVQ